MLSLSRTLILIDVQNNPLTPACFAVSAAAAPSASSPRPRFSSLFVAWRDARSQSVRVSLCRALEGGSSDARGAPFLVLARAGGGEARTAAAALAFTCAGGAVLVVAGAVTNTRVEGLREGGEDEVTGRCGSGGGGEGGEGGEGGGRAPPGSAELAAGGGADAEPCPSLLAFDLADAESQLSRQQASGSNGAAAEALLYPSAQSSLLFSHMAPPPAAVAFCALAAVAPPRNRSRTNNGRGASGEKSGDGPRDGSVWVVAGGEACSVPFVLAKSGGAAAQDVQRWSFARQDGFNAACTATCTAVVCAWPPVPPSSGLGIGLFDDAAAVAADEYASAAAGSVATLYLGGAAPLVTGLAIPPHGGEPDLDSSLAAHVSAAISLISSTTALMMRPVAAFSRIFSSPFSEPPMLPQANAGAQPERSPEDPPARPMRAARSLGGSYLESSDGGGGADDPVFAPFAIAEAQIEGGTQSFPRAAGNSAKILAPFPDRFAVQLVADPSGRLLACATSDSRVLLLRASNLAVLRVWKGLRGAQVAFLGALERTRAPRLLIYAPTRGVLDAWAVPSGSETPVASLVVTREAVLISGSDGAAGRCFVAVPAADGTPMLSLHEVISNEEGD